MISRRSFLRKTGAILAANSFSACSLLPGSPEPICPFDADLTNTDSLLAIDMHAHIFNASDLQVQDFIRRVAIRQDGGLGALAEIFGGILQDFAWRTAPSAVEEMQKLNELRPAILNCDAAANLSDLTVLRQQKYKQAREELLESAEGRLQANTLLATEIRGPAESLSPAGLGLLQILQLPETYEDFFAPPAAAMSIRNQTPASVLKFVIQMLQYRFVSVYTYLETYNRHSDLAIDLITPAAVDFDWWLSRGVPTRSRLPDQMTLMAEISVLTGGRVHALVPFDPFRQVVHDLGNESGFSPFDLVQTAIEQQGAIGVKLYPPMGFAPFGNEQIGVGTPDMWAKRPWLSAIARRGDFPVRLDESLARLYDYCARNAVPVMGHANESNGPADDFEALTAPVHWQMARERFLRVSFCFGHFGGVGSESEPGESNAEGFLKLMEADQLTEPRRTAADASYFSNLLQRPEALQNALRAVYNFGDSEPGPALDGLMYGSDWKMLAAEAGAENYLRDFNNVLSRLENEFGSENRLKEKFFGRNASSFLGLFRGSKNRARLERFYDANGISTAPTWMSKVDNLFS